MSPKLLVWIGLILTASAAAGCVMNESENYEYGACTFKDYDQTTGKESTGYYCTNDLTEATCNGKPYSHYFEEGRCCNPDNAHVTNPERCK